MAEEQPRVSLVIHSAAGAFEVLPPSAQLIFGQYSTDGWNHGKRVYRRLRVGSKKFHPEALLFYWDDRGGTELSGWWIGSQIAGGDVWARNEAASPLPPESGWRCPVDGPVLEHVRCSQPLLPRPPPAPCGPERGIMAEESAGRFGPGSPPVKRARSTPASAAERHQSEMLVLLCQHPDAAPESCRRVLGEYVQHGYSHGRKTFCKHPSSCFSGRPVWLYYEDGGWWLGESIGIGQTFGVARQATMTPPTANWQVPPFEPARSDLRLVPKGQEESAHLQWEQSKEGRIKKAWDIASSVEAAADDTVADTLILLPPLLGARGCDGRGLGGSEVGAAASEVAVRRAVEALRARIEEVEAALRSVTAAGRVPFFRGIKQEEPDDTDMEFGLLSERLQATLTGLQEQLLRAEQHLEEVEWEVLDGLDCEDEEDADQEVDDAGQHESAEEGVTQEEDDDDEDGESEADVS